MCDSIGHFLFYNFLFLLLLVFFIPSERLFSLCSELSRGRVFLFVLCPFAKANGKGYYRFDLNLLSLLRNIKELNPKAILCRLR